MTWASAVSGTRSRTRCFPARPPCTLASDTCSSSPGCCRTPATGRALLTAPAPFTGGHLLPLGLTDGQPWPFPATPERVLAISPFLSTGTLARIRGTCPQATLVSRAESIDRVGPDWLTGWDTTTLHPGVENGQDDSDAVRALDEFTAVVDTPEHAAPASAQFEDLHAKTEVLGLPGGQSMTVTGSTNLTEQAWSGGLEMDAVLTGPTSACGVQAVLGEGKD